MAKQNESEVASSSWSRRFACLVLLAVTLPLGIAWRMAPLHLPPFAYKYGGSALWAVAVYWAVAIVMPRRPAIQLGMVAALIALGVELGKRVYWPPLDRFRETLAGKLLLGRYFTFRAIVAYGLAITIAGLLDARFRPGLARTGSGTHRMERAG